MSHTFQCGDNAALVSYLYDECEPADRAAIDAHVALCAACAAELGALQSARLHLASWAPPPAELGFQIVRPEVAALRPLTSGARSPRPEASARVGRWFSRPLPVWAQAAAACLLFAAGLWLGVVRGNGRETPDAAAIGTTPLTASGASATGAANSELVALERRLRAEMAQLRTAPVNAGAAAPDNAAEARLLARVRALIDESEQRQQRELALRTAQVIRDFDSQRQFDLAQIQRSVGQVESSTGAEVREQRQLLDYLMRVSEQR